MQSDKNLYRRLAKKYHPDLAAGPTEKPIHEQLMTEINAAYERGDIKALRDIEAMGPTYLVYKFYADGLISAAEPAEPVKEKCQPSPPVANASSKPKTLFRKILALAHPYSLLRISKNWDGTSRLGKLTSILSSLGWTLAFGKAWAAIDVLSSWLAANGYPHASIYGLVIVLLKGTLFFIALPTIGPLGLLAALIALCLTAVYLVTSVASHILALFHPLLAYLPPVIAAPILLWFAWAMLGDE